METVVPFQVSSYRDVEDLARRIRELGGAAIHNDLEYIVTEPSLLKQCATELETKAMQIVEECSNVSSLETEVFDAYLNDLKEELRKTEDKSAKISEEIEILGRKTNEDFLQFENNLQVLKCSLEHIQRQTVEGDENYADPKLLSSDDNELQVKIVSQKVEQFEEILRVFEEYDNLFERWEAVNDVENLFSSINVVDFDGKNIHLELKSFVHEMNNSIEIQHEMVIEVHPKSMELINVKISPNDVYIDGLVTAAKSLSYSNSGAALTNPLEMFVRKVQQRIVQRYTRQRIAEDISQNPRSFCKYVDKDEAFVVQLPGEVNACIKVGQNWPVLNSPLQLISLKGKTGKDSALLHKVNESLQLKEHCDLSSFIDAIDDAVGKHM